MKRGRKLKLTFLAVAAMSCTASACPPTEERPRTVSDFCLNAKRITSNVAATEHTEDAEPGNQFDTDETVFQTYAHNSVFDRLCANRD